MNLHQRQEQSSRTISGRKINNYFTCTVKQVKKMSPSKPYEYEQGAREITFQTDSFKQLLTKRSGCQVNKENISTNNRMMKKIKESVRKESVVNREQNEDKKKSKSTLRMDKKSSAVSLTKIFQRNRSANEHRKKETKSMSPSRDIKEYRSGPAQKKNYLSNNASSKVKQVMPSKSEKSLTDRFKNPLKAAINTLKKDQKQKKQGRKQLTKTKKSKNQSLKILINPNNAKKSQNLQKTERIAKQFDSILKLTKNKVKKSNKKNVQTNSKQKQRQKKKKSKQKKVIVSQNNSKNFISKYRINSDYSDQSHDSPDRIALSTRYDAKKQNTKRQRQRLSFDPTKKKGKSKDKAKTEALSPQKSLANKNQAAKIIQKVFRGYLTRKYISQFKNIITSVIKIQKVWRGHKARTQVKQLKQKLQRQKNMKKQQLRFDKFSLLVQSESSDKKMVTPRQNQLTSLLEQILNEDNVNEIIKSRITNFLKKQQKGKSSKSSSAVSHQIQQQMRSQKRFFEQIDKHKHKFGSPVPLIKYSPKLQKSSLQKSPQLLVQNLLAIKQFQRQKLINNAKMQIEGLDNLTMKSLFSPRTRDIKKYQVHRKLEQDLTKFDESISEVIKTCKQSDNTVGQFRPFPAISTPERFKKIPDIFPHINPQTSPHMQIISSPSPYDSNPNFQLKPPNLIGTPQHSNNLEDLSMQLLEYYQQKTQDKLQNTKNKSKNQQQHKHQIIQYQKIDSSYQFIQEYLLALFEYLQLMGDTYWTHFINVMRSSKNLQMLSLLKNLNILTQDSQEQDQDFGFKLPMYKYLEQSSTPQIIDRKIVQQFNSSYQKLQRNQLGTHHSNLQDIYIKMLIDAINEALNLQRPNTYLFTESVLKGRAKRMFKQVDQEQNQAQFSFYFATSMNYMYKWAHLQCGRIISLQVHEQPLRRSQLSKQQQQQQQQQQLSPNNINNLSNPTSPNFDQNQNNTILPSRSNNNNNNNNNNNTDNNLDNDNDNNNNIINNIQIIQPNEQSLKQLLKIEIEKEMQNNFYDQLLEIIVLVANSVYEEILLEEIVTLFL